MRWTVLTLIAVLFSFPYETSARIGETFEQCKERYGDPVHADSTLTGFVKSGMRIIVSFYNDKVSLIAYKKMKEDILGNPEEITDNEKQILLDANSGGKKWVKMNVISMREQWATEDSELFANYDPMERGLMIATKGHLERMKQQTQDKEREKLKDF